MTIGNPHGWAEGRAAADLASFDNHRPVAAPPPFAQ